MDGQRDTELQALAAEFYCAAESDRARGADLAEEIVVRARRVDYLSGEAAAAAQGARCHLLVRDRRYPERVERAIKLLERAETLYDEHPDVGDRHARRQVRANLAGALGERSRQDPAANQQRAIDIQKRLLVDLTDDDDADLRAKTTHTWPPTCSRSRSRPMTATTGRSVTSARSSVTCTRRSHGAARTETRSTGRTRSCTSVTHTPRAADHATLRPSTLISPSAASRALARTSWPPGHEPTSSLRGYAEAYSDDVTAERRLTVARQAVREARAALKVLTNGEGTVVRRRSMVGSWRAPSRSPSPGPPEIAQALRRTLEHWTAKTVPRRAQTVARALAVVCEKAGDLGRGSRRLGRDRAGRRRCDGPPKHPGGPAG